MVMKAMAKLAEKVKEEDGEIGSWMVIAAMLAVAAAGAAALIGPWINGNVQQIVN